MTLKDRRGFAVGHPFSNLSSVHNEMVSWGVIKDLEEITNLLQE